MSITSDNTRSGRAPDLRHSKALIAGMSEHRNWTIRLDRAVAVETHCSSGHWSAGLSVFQQRLQLIPGAGQLGTVREKHPGAAPHKQATEGLLCDFEVCGEPLWCALEPSAHNSDAVPDEQHSQFFIYEAQVARGMSRRCEYPQRPDDIPVRQRAQSRQALHWTSQDGCCGSCLPHVAKGTNMAGVSVGDEDER